MRKRSEDCRQGRHERGRPFSNKVPADYALPTRYNMRVARDDAVPALLLLEPLVATAGDKGVAFLLAACADMSGHDEGPVWACVL